jgi:soluble lytic murein transglycosylase-like protein
MKLGYKFGITTALLALASLPASAAEMAVLRNGFSIHDQRHEARENMTRLYLTVGPDSYVDVPTADIAGFEQEEDRPLPPSSSPAPVSNLDAVVSAASNRNNINPDLIYSVIRAESGFNPNAVSPKGAQGLMQLMPQTAARLGVQNAMDPTANVEGGTRYLRELLALYHNDLSKALAAYNAGPERVEQYHGVPPYRETVDYVSRVIRDFNRTKVVQQYPQPDPAGNRGVERNSKATAPRRSKIVRPVAARDASSAGAGS